ncbi:hypothetical protein C8Q79DRAFT_409889 [Trametes meyenii]|nr:hypothetical protein C8Q79DRAFT_409889 [Trametes meyenii]
MASALYTERLRCSESSRGLDAGSCPCHTTSRRSVDEVTCSPPPAGFRRIDKTILRPTTGKLRIRAFDWAEDYGSRARAPPPTALAKLSPRVLPTLPRAYWTLPGALGPTRKLRNRAPPPRVAAAPATGVPFLRPPCRWSYSRTLLGGPCRLSRTCAGGCCRRRRRPTRPDALLSAPAAAVQNTSRGEGRAWRVSIYDPAS